MSAFELSSNAAYASDSDAPPVVAVIIHILADATPGLLPRLLEPFARRDVTPDRVQARREAEAMRVEIALDAVEEDALARILGNLGQVIGVRSVRAVETVARERAA